VTPSRTTDTDATAAAAAAAVCSLAILWQSLPPSVYGRIDTRCGRHPTHSTTFTAVDTAALSTRQSLAVTVTVSQLCCSHFADVALSTALSTATRRRSTVHSPVACSHRHRRPTVVQPLSMLRRLAALSLPLDSLVQLVSRLVTEDCWRAGESITDNKHRRHCHRRCCSSSSSLLSRQSLAVTATVGRLCCSHCRRRWQTTH